MMGRFRILVAGLFAWTLLLKEHLILSYPVQTLCASLFEVMAYYITFL